MSSKASVYMFLPGYPVDPDFADSGRADCIRFFIQKSIQDIFNGLPNRSVRCSITSFSLTLMAPEIDFSFFLRHIFHSLFPFGWFWVGIIINHGNRLFQASIPSNVRNFSDVIFNRHLENETEVLRIWAFLISIYFPM